MHAANGSRVIVFAEKKNSRYQCCRRYRKDSDNLDIHCKGFSIVFGISLPSASWIKNKRGTKFQISDRRDYGCSVTVPILPLNPPPKKKWGLSAPNFASLDENFPTAHNLAGQFPPPPPCNDGTGSLRCGTFSCYSGLVVVYLIYYLLSVCYYYCHHLLWIQLTIFSHPPHSDSVHALACTYSHFNKKTALMLMRRTTASA